MIESWTGYGETTPQLARIPPTSAGGPAGADGGDDLVRAEAGAGGKDHEGVAGL
jgi:hypothetical protein